MIVLYRSTLLSSDAGDFLPMTQYKSFTFRSICFLFLAKCSAHVSRESKCRPRYFAVGDCGITVLCMWTTGHRSFLSVKVTCIDFVALILIRHFFSQASDWSRWPCSLCEAVSCKMKWKWSHFFNRQWRPLALWAIEDPTFSRKSNHRWHSDCGRTSHLRKIPDTHFCYRLNWPQGHNAAGKIV
jgi:hypothetical protein